MSHYLDEEISHEKDGQAELIPEQGYNSYAVVQTSYPGIGLNPYSYSAFMSSFNSTTEGSFTCPNSTIAPGGFCYINSTCTDVTYKYNLTNYGFSMYLEAGSNVGNASLGLEALLVNNGTVLDPKCFLLVGQIGDENIQSDATIVLGMQWLYNYYVELAFNSY